MSEYDPRQPVPGSQDEVPGSREPVPGTRPEDDAEREEFERWRAERAAQAEPEAGQPPEPTHDLLLANGETVEHYGAIPTHVAVGDRNVPVLAVSERVR
jgi:hypothetical protein